MVMPRVRAKPMLICAKSDSKNLRNIWNDPAIAAFMARSGVEVPV